MELVNIFIQKKIESGNKYTYQFGRGACWAYKKYKDGWEAILGYVMGSPQTPCEVKRVVKILSIRKRLIDEDNLRMGCKCVVDAVKRLGWLKDDSPKWVEITVRQIQVKYTADQLEGTRIAVEELQCKQKHK